MFKEITVCKAKRRKIVGYLLGLAVFCAFPCLTILVFKTVREFFLILTIFAVGLTIVLLITLKFLTKKLKKIGLECMKDAIKSIKT